MSTQPFSYNTTETFTSVFPDFRLDWRWCQFSSLLQHLILKCLLKHLKDQFAKVQTLYTYTLIYLILSEFCDCFKVKTDSVWSLQTTVSRSIISSPWVESWYHFYSGWLHVLNWFLYYYIINKLLSLGDTKTVSTTTISSWLDCCNSLWNRSLTLSRLHLVLKVAARKSDGSADCVFWIKLCFSTSLYILYFISYLCPVFMWKHSSSTLLNISHLS